MHTILLISAMIAYIIATTGWISGRANLRPHDAASVGVVLHAAALVWSATQGDNVATSFASSLSAVASMLAVAAVLLPGPRLDAVRGGLLASATFGMLMSLLVPESEVSALRTFGPSVWLPLHLGFVFTGFTALFIEFCLSIVEAVTHRRLKAKRLDELTRMPPLDTVATLRLRALGTGVVSLALGLLSGGIWAALTMNHAAWLGSFKVWFTLIVWVWYAVALGLHRLSRGHAKYALFWSVIGVAGLLFGFIGLDFVTGGFHAYGG